MLKANLTRLTFTFIMLLSSGFAPLSAQEETPDRLAVEITIGSRTLQLPVSRPKESNLVFAVVPLTDTTSIRVVPLQLGGYIKMETELVSSERVSKAKNCAEKYRMTGDKSGTYVISAGESIILNKVEVSIKFKAIPAEASQSKHPTSLTQQANSFMAKTTTAFDTCPCSKCKNGDGTYTLCCPNVNSCISCANCGDICCLKDTSQIMVQDN